MAIPLDNRRISFLASFPTDVLSAQRIPSYSCLHMQNEWIFIFKVSFCLFPQQQQQQEIGNTNSSFKLFDYRSLVNIKCLLHFKYTKYTHLLLYLYLFVNQKT